MARRWASPNRCPIASCPWWACGNAARGPISGRWNGATSFSGAACRASRSRTGFARVDPAKLSIQLQKILRLCPALANVAVIRQWSGCEGYVEDGLPVMGASRTTPGLFHAFGFCGHGFQLGPGVGETMATLVTTGQSPLPIDAMSIGRFAA